ncbi:MAG TPA: type II toxin-antitoxin system PrlF family antitoxin [Chloroflexota bacterium]|nr:type II toxin-antitoxin system PrlF family antitoxin [Chloroflexota bacterium]
MKHILATVTERGQTTIPAEVRRTLGLRAPGKVAFAIDEEGVRLVPVSFTLSSAFGSVPPLTQPEDFKAISREARVEASRRSLGKLRRG